MADEETNLNICVQCVFTLKEVQSCMKFKNIRTVDSYI